MKRYLSLLLAFVAAPAVVVGAAAGPAVADVAADPAAVAAPATVDSAVTDPLKFWTKERMAKAQPADLPEAATSAAGAASAVAASGAPVAHSGALPLKAAGVATKPADFEPMAGGFEWPGPQHTTPASTSGRIFWSTPGKIHYCSGSAVNSGNKDLVFTAGHCIHDGPGGGYLLANSWVFAPNYRDGVDPAYGLWSPRIMQTTNGWALSGDVRYDMGAVVMFANAGQHLVNVVGGQGFTWNQPSVQFMIGFGYPAEAPYNGSRLIYCNGNTFLDNAMAAPKPIGLTCDQTPGSSGGPWLRAMDASTGLGWLNSVYSYKKAGVPSQSYGPYFGAGAGNLFNANANV